LKTGLKVGDAMTKSPIYVSPENTLKEVASIMANNHVGAVLVKEDGTLLGILSEQDIVRKAVKQGLDPSTTKAENIMATDIKTISPNEDIVEAMKIMKEENIRHLPVLHNREMLGLLTTKDILKLQPQLFELLVDRIELREAERKANLLPKEKEGICNLCGNYSEEVFLIKGSYVCEDCRDQV